MATDNIFKKMQQREEERDASIRLAPYGELPTSDFTDAPATAHAVNATPEPQSMQKEWDKMAFYEKFWNSATGGYHNLQKGEAAQDIIDYAIAKEKGILGGLEEDLEERFENEEDRKKFEILRGSNVDKDYIKEQDKKLTQAIRDFEELSVYDNEYKTPDVVTRASKATEGKSFIDSIAPFLGEVAKNPLDYAIYLTGSSMGAIAPSLAMSMVSGTAIGRLLKMKTTARAIQTALMGYGSYNAEVGSYIMNEWQEKGYDLRDADSVRRAVENEDLVDLKTRAIRRGAVVGLFDAFSAWIAPMRLNPSNALRFLRSNATKATSGLVAPVSRTIRFGKGFENLSLQTSLQGVLGGAGEAFGQIANGEEINWGEVFAEAIGEFTSAPFEVLGLSWSVNAEFNRETAKYNEVKANKKAFDDIVAYTAAVSKKIGDNQTVEQWAEGVGKDNKLFAFAQDLVEQGIPDKIRETNPELAQRIEEAAQEKKDITIEMSEVLKTAVTDEATAKAMIHETRFNPDGMSQRQAEEFEKNGKKEAIDRFQKIQERAQPDIERRKAIDTAIDKIEDNLVKEGVAKDVAHTSSMPWRAHIAILSNQLGQTPEEIMSRFGNMLIQFQGGKPVGFAQAGLFRQGTGKKLDKQFTDNQRKLANWTPETYKSREGQEGQYRGAPPGINTIEDFNELVEKLKGYAQEGVAGRFWYEVSAEYVYELVRGNIKDADKIIRLIAIFSPQMEIAPNLLLALRAWDYYKSGKPEKGLKIKTDLQNEQAKAVLWHDGDWNGRKTNSFYQNLMYALIMQHPEECKAVGLDIEGFKRGQSTIDMWIRRVLGYPNDSTADDKGTGAYTFAENTLAKIAAQLNQNLAPDEEPWTPHQVQAAIWTSVKSRYELSKAEAWKHLGEIGQLEMAPVIDKETKLQKINKDGTPRVKESKKKGVENENIQHEVEFQFAEKVNSAEAKAYSDAFARSFATELNRMVQNVTWEAMPSKDIPGTEALLKASSEVKRHFTEEVARIFSDPNEIDKVVKALNGGRSIVHLGKTAPGNGGYQGVISPNIITQMLPVWWDDAGEPSKAFVRAYCRILQYVLKQEAIPFFRFENRPTRIKKNPFKVGNRNFATQEEAQKYADDMNKKHPPEGKKSGKNKEVTTENGEKTQEAKPKYFVVGGQLSRAVVFTFESTPTNAQLEDLFAKIIKATGVKDSGLTRIDNKVIVANFRGGEHNLPEITDEAFVSALKTISLQGIAKAKSTWVDSEYGHSQDWKSDPTGSELLGLIDEAVKESRQDGNHRNDTSRPQRDGESGSQELQDTLDHWKAAYEGILAKYTESYIQGLEQELARQQEARLQVGGQDAFAQGLTSLLLQQTRPNSGYRGNKSVRALSAEAFGGKPWSKWNKQNILDQIEYEYGDTYPEVVEAAKNASLDALKELVLENQGWHHVGGNYRATAYFFVRDLSSKNEAQELIKSLQEYQKKPSQVVSAQIDGKTYKGVLTGATFRYVDENGNLRTNTLSKRGDWNMASYANPITDEAEAQRTRDEIAQRTPSPKNRPKKMRFAKVRTKDGEVHYAKVYDNKSVRLVPKWHEEKWKDVDSAFTIGTDAEIVEEMNEDNRSRFASDILDLKIDYAERRKKEREEAYNRYDANSRKVEPNQSEKQREQNERYWNRFADKEAEKIEELENRIEMLKQAKAELANEEKPRLDLIALLQLAYHGSPYNFDRFSLEHIGKGEGAQVHGWGLYFALNRKIAENYKKYLTGLAQNPWKVYIDAKKEIEEEMAKVSILKRRSYERKLELLEDFNALNFDLNRFDKYLAEKKNRTNKETLEWFNSEIRPRIVKRSATLYTVDIPEDDVMLREDAMFKDQPPKVQEAIKKIWEELKLMDSDESRQEWLDEIERNAEGELSGNTLYALLDLAKKEGPGFFNDKEKVLERLMPAIEADAKEVYENNKEDYDGNASGDMTGLDLAIAENVWFVRDNGWLTYPAEVAGDFLPFGYSGHKGRDIYGFLSDSLGDDMEASLMLNKYGVKGIRYHGGRDGECAVVFDDTTIKIVDMLNQLAYHGTPYEKNILKFTLEHIGEGEGAQAHGYGLYFALLQEVARGYKDELSYGSYQVQGQDEFSFRRDLELSQIDVKGKERNRIRERLAAFDVWYKSHDVADVKKAYDRGEITLGAYRWFNKEVAPNIESPGGLYLVDIPEDNELMREDATLAEQSEYVQERLKKAIEALDPPKGNSNQAFLEGVNREIEGSELAQAKKTTALIREIADKEGQSAFEDSSYGSTLMERLREALRKDAEEEYKNNKEDYDASETTVDDIESNFLDFASALVGSIHGIETEASGWAVYEKLLGSLESGKMYSVYKNLSSLLGGKKQASEYLNKYGIKGIRYDGRRDGECAVVWDEESIKILERLQQISEQAGPEKIRGSYLPRNTSQKYRQSVITLMENYDKSTFLHESAHAWLDLDTMLALDVADKIDRGEELTEGEKAFMQNLGGFFRWGQQEGVLDLGVTDDIKTVANAVRRWSEMDTEQQRGMHELFAEGFEAYLMEGVSPNKEMESVFHQFKKWLIDIYSKLVRQPKPISKEVRKLYDLMFATEQQAEETETKLGLRAMFDKDLAKKAGMSDEETQQYMTLAERATQTTAGLVAKAVHGAMRIFGRVRKAEYRRIERERRDEIKKREEELRKEPRYKALSMLNSNKVKMSEESLKSLGLSEETINLFKDRNWVSSDSGVSLHVLASTVGTDDVSNLLYDLVDLERMSDAHDEVIKQLAWEDKVEHEGEGDFNELQANLCAYNETRSRLLTAEFNAIMRKLGGQQLMVRAAREYALEQIGKLKISELYPYSYMNAERRCAREADEAFRKGDFNAVVEAKRAQILNHELARAALEAQDRYERGVRSAKKALKSKSIHPLYKRIIDALLEAHSVSTMKAEDRQKFALGEPLSASEINQLETTLKDNGTPIEGIADIIRDKKHAKEMTASESQEFFSVLKQVETIGRNQLKMSKIQEGQRVDEVTAKLEAQIEESAKAQGRERKTDIHEPRTQKQTRKKNLMNFLLGNTKVSALCKIFDGNKAGGIFWEVFVKPANECATFEAEQRKKASEWLRDKFLPAFKKNQDEDPIMITGFDEPMTHGTRIAVALNLGNESNRQRLVQNDPRFTPEALQEIMDSLTEADWRAIEAVWQLFESLRPMIAEKQMRVYGVEPEWIEYEPFFVTTKEGKQIQVSGGYYPVVYDYEASDVSGQLQEAKDVERMMQNAYQSPTTERSFTKKRVPGDVTGRPLRLNLSVLYDGINDVIHDLAWHEYLIDTGHILHGSTMSQSNGIKQSIKELYGSDVANEIEQWRNDIALGDRGVGTPAWFTALTRNVGLASMGYSLTTAAAQVTGVGYVIPQTGVPAFIKALSTYMVHPFSTRRKINQMSDAMRLRAQTQFKELAQIRNRLERGKGTISWMQEHAYVLTEIVQGFADTVSWQAAYERFKRDGFEGDKLIKMCDQVVVSTQASGNIHDLSRYERTKSYAKIFGVFYSWMNAALNLSITEYFGETNKFKKIANLFWMCVLMPYIEQSFRDALSADDDDDDKDKDNIDKYVRDPLASVVEYNLGQFMYLREFSNTASRAVKGEPIFGYSGPAGLRTFKIGNEAVASLGKLAQTYDDPNYDRIIKNIIDVSGVAIGAPSSQVQRTIKGLKAVDQGRVEGIDAIKAPLFGYKGRVD